MCTSIFNMFRGVSTFAKTMCDDVREWNHGGCQSVPDLQWSGLDSLPCSVALAMHGRQCRMAKCVDVSVPAIFRIPRKVLFSLASWCLTIGGWGVLYVWTIPHMCLGSWVFLVWLRDPIRQWIFSEWADVGNRLSKTGTPNIPNRKAIFHGRLTIQNVNNMIVLWRFNGSYLVCMIMSSFVPS